AASADSPARRQRRGARDRGQPPGADGLRLPVGRSRARRVRSLSRAGQEARLAPRPRALPPRAPRLRGRDERAGPRGGRAASRLLLAEAPELSPRLDGPHGTVGAAATSADREGRGPAALRVRLRSVSEGGVVDRVRSGL